MSKTGWWGGLAASLRGEVWRSAIWEEGRETATLRKALATLLGSWQARISGGRAHRSATTPAPGREGQPAIARSWRGATRTADAEAYVRYVERTGIAAYRRAPGFRAAWILTRDRGDVAEFLVFSLWGSDEGIRAFAGPEPQRAVFFPEDDAFLVERDEGVDHWRVRAIC